MLKKELGKLVSKAKNKIEQGKKNISEIIETSVNEIAAGLLGPQLKPIPLKTTKPPSR